VITAGTAVPRRDEQLFKSLCIELNKSNGSILSLDVIDKAGKIGKLAKRIKGTAKGF
jgi:hypothetical protein